MTAGFDGRSIQVFPFTEAYYMDYRTGYSDEDQAANMSGKHGVGTDSWPTNGCIRRRGNFISRTAKVDVRRGGRYAWRLIPITGPRAPAGQFARVRAGRGKRPCAGAVPQRAVMELQGN